MALSVLVLQTLAVHLRSVDQDPLSPTGSLSRSLSNKCFPDVEPHLRRLSRDDHFFKPGMVFVTTGPYGGEQSDVLHVAATHSRVDVYMLEPDVASYNSLRNRTADKYPNIHLLNVGIGSKSGKACFKQEEPAPSDEDDAPADDTAAANATATAAKDSSGCGLLATAGALDTPENLFGHLARIDVLQLNCDGCEYGLLPALLASPATLAKIDYLEVQFHNCGSENLKEYCSVTAALQKAFDVEYNADCVWTRFKRKNTAALSKYHVLDKPLTDVLHVSANETANESADGNQSNASLKSAPDPRSKAGAARAPPGKGKDASPAGQAKATPRKEGVPQPLSGGKPNQTNTSADNQSTFSVKESSSAFQWPEIPHSLDMLVKPKRRRTEAESTPSTESAGGNLTNTSADLREKLSSVRNSTLNDSESANSSLLNGSASANSSSNTSVFLEYVDDYRYRDHPPDTVVTTEPENDPSDAELLREAGQSDKDGDGDDDKPSNQTKSKNLSFARTVRPHSNPKNTSWKIPDYVPRGPPEPKSSPPSLPSFTPSGKSGATSEESEVPTYKGNHADGSKRNSSEKVKHSNSSKRNSSSEKFKHSRRLPALDQESSSQITANSSLANSSSDKYGHIRVNAALRNSSNESEGYMIDFRNSPGNQSKSNTSELKAF